MIIGCSECGTRYVVAPEAIGKDGRRVKCSKCNNVWFQDPAPEDHEIVPGPEELTKDGAAKTAPSSEETEKGEQSNDGNDKKAGKKDNDPLGIFGSDVRRNVPVVVKNHDYKLIIGWVALVIFVVGLVGGLYYFRRDIERSSDFAEILYEKWDALVLKERQGNQSSEPETVQEIMPHPSTFLSMRQSVEVRLNEGSPSLYIATEVRNSSTYDIELPEMKGIIRDANGVEVFTWAQPITPSIVPANDVLQFEVIVDNIPAETSEAELIFLWPGPREN